MQGDSHLAKQYVQIVSEVIGLYKQQLAVLRESGDEVFLDTLQKIVVGVEGLSIEDSGGVPLARALPQPAT